MIGARKGGRVSERSMQDGSATLVTHLHADLPPRGAGVFPH